MKEQLTNEILNKMVGVLNQEQLDKLSNAIIISLSGYDLGKQCTEITPYDDSNMVCVKKYFQCKILEGMAKSSIEQYRYTIFSLIYNIGKNLNEITSDDIRVYLSTYNELSGVKKNTLDNKRRQLSAFFSWLKDENYIETNPMCRIKRIKAEKEIKIPFSSYEIESMRVVIKSIKERAIFEFLLATGVRVGELCNLKISDVDFRKKEVKVFGKGSKERIVPISDAGIFHLNRYLETRKDEEDILFLNRNGNRYRNQAIERMMHRIGDEAHVENVHPHRFRRTLASSLIKKGCSVQIVQKILGHTNLNTTMIYCYVDRSDMKNEYNKVS